jgi:phosphoglycolate phosphatase-like HAD superfamily hydrolase
VFRVLALDFDGVISNSAPEAFVVALRSYVGLRPASPLADTEFTGDETPSKEAVAADPVYGSFLAAMPLGNRAEDFGVVLSAIEAGRPLNTQSDYDRFGAEIDPAWLQTYHERFYRVREALCEADLAAWLALMGPYPAFVEVLRRHVGEVEMAIATAKDRISVRHLLAAYAIEDLFPESAVLDKEVGRSKVAHLEQLQAVHGCAFSEILFIDDKVNHLDSVAALGVRCGLASWGFNGDREAALAKRSGYRVFSLDDVESRLFGE